MPRSAKMGEAPAAEKDFRTILEQKDVDAITIATPDHWHTPMAIAGLQAGKHVYVEKPCSHNPAEGGCWWRRRRNMESWCRWARQQRSSPHTIEIVEKIHGRRDRQAVPCEKPGTANVRKSIGTGKEAPVPAQLDWELWQGPAPRRPYRDNVPSFTTGTGSETTAPAKRLNNGTHEVDVCRWALGVDYPKRVTASGADTSSKTTGNFTTRW